MTWLHLSLIPPLLWSVVNTVDKVVVGKYISRPIVYLIFTGFASLLPVIILPFFVDLQELSTLYLALSMLIGILYISYTYFFFRALQIADAPVVANLLLLVPIVCAVFGAIFFGERFELLTYLGIALVIVGVLGTSLERKETGEAAKTAKMVITPALILMTISAVLTGVDYALQKQVLTVTNEVTVFYWSRVGVLLATLCIVGLFQRVRKDFIDVARAIPNKIFPISFCNEGLDMIAAFVLLAAYARGPLSLVATVISIQPLFILFLVAGLNAIRQGLVPSSSDRKYFWVRFISISITICGIYFLSTGST